MFLLYHKWVIRLIKMDKMFEIYKFKANIYQYLFNDRSNFVPTLFHLGNK